VVHVVGARGDMAVMREGVGRVKASKGNFMTLIVIRGLNGIY
jgi:hypothetical protein